MVSQGIPSPSLQRRDHSQTPIAQCFKNGNQPKIKVVDVKKLLPSHHESARNMSSVSSVLQEHDAQEQSATSKSPHKPLNENGQKLNTPANKSSIISKTTFRCRNLDTCNCIKVSHVLECLKVILPNKFDFSKLAPNEKLSALVIKYLKLDDNESSQNIVKRYLEIIIKSVKLKKKPFEGYYRQHPYSRIKMISSQAALAILLPNDFSMEDVTDEILNCFCVILNQEIYSDSYTRLHGKFRDFISRGRRFFYIVNFEVDKLLAPENKIMDGNKIERVSRAGGETKNNSSILSNSRSSKINETKQFDNAIISPDNASHIVKPPGVIAGGEDSEQPEASSTTIQESESSDVSTDSEEKSDHGPVIKKNLFNLKDIVAFLKERQLSGKDVIRDSNLLFALCKYIKVKWKYSMLQTLKTALLFIMKNDVNENNVEVFSKKCNLQKIYRPKELERCKPHVVEKCENNLTLQPIVKLCDIANYSIDDMLFMKDEGKSHESSGTYNKEIRFSFQNNIKQYSSDHVRKLTEKSYRSYRKIIMKRDGSKVVFRLKYARLAPGSKVFIKDYRNPALGWVQAVVKKKMGSLRYRVQLDNGEYYLCVADQLRPLVVRSLLDRIPNNTNKPTHPRLQRKQISHL